MYSTVKTLSAICVIGAVINGIAALIFTLYTLNEGMDMMKLYTLYALLYSAPVVMIALSAALRSIYASLNVQADRQLEEYTELRKRIETLEKQVKQ